MATPVLQFSTPIFREFKETCRSFICACETEDSNDSESEVDDVNVYTLNTDETKVTENLQEKVGSIGSL